MQSAVADQDRPASRQSLDNLPPRDTAAVAWALGSVEQRTDTNQPPASGSDRHPQLSLAAG
jgi:hypothetical protein